MKRSRLTWFAFDVSDFLHNDARLMSLAETGAYVKLLCHAYLDSRCTLPSDEKILVRLLGVTPKEWAQVRAAVLDKFTLGEDGRLYNQDLLDERTIAERKSAKAREHIESRWQKAREESGLVSTKKLNQTRDETKRDEATYIRPHPRTNVRT